MNGSRTDRVIRQSAQLSGEEGRQLALALASQRIGLLEGVLCVAMLGDELTLELVRGRDGSLSVEGIRGLEGGKP